MIHSIMYFTCALCLFVLIHPPGDVSFQTSLLFWLVLILCVALTIYSWKSNRWDDRYLFVIATLITVRSLLTLGIYPTLFTLGLLQVPLSLPSSLPPSLPLSLSPSLPLRLSPSLPPFLPPSLSLSPFLSPSLPLRHSPSPARPLSLCLCLYVYATNHWVV